MFNICPLHDKGLKFFIKLTDRIVDLFSKSVKFGPNEVQAVPDWQEGDSDKETESPAEVGYEGDGGVGPDLPLYPHIMRLKSQEKREVGGIGLIVYVAGDYISSPFIFLEIVLQMISY